MEVENATLGRTEVEVVCSAAEHGFKSSQVTSALNMLKQAQVLNLSPWLVMVTYIFILVVLSSTRCNLCIFRPLKN